MAFIKKCYAIGICTNSHHAPFGMESFFARFGMELGSRSREQEFRLEYMQAALFETGDDSKRWNCSNYSSERHDKTLLTTNQVC
ncbi:MAG: hypothetical protein JRN52_15285 [Nitrososphaerota archaeon]|nr:hypothetical protein [Nitrososphaerota archaeon]